MPTMCEDYPCCGHEMGDCDGSKYGSDESIKTRVEEQWRTGHGMCDHADGIFNCEYDEDEEDDEDYIETTCSGCMNALVLELDEERVVANPQVWLNQETPGPKADLSRNDVGLLIWDCPVCGYADSFDRDA